MIYRENWIVQPVINKRKVYKNCLVILDNGEEKIYVNVMYIKKSGDIIGNITNNIILKEKPYKPDDLVYFQKQHILQMLTLEERREKANSLIPDLSKMCALYRDDFVKLNGRLPTKAETELYFEEHVNIL